jgi:hypothetical protein
MQQQHPLLLLLVVMVLVPAPLLRLPSCASLPLW